MKKKPLTISETLRKKVMTDFENGESFRAIERDTGVLRQSLMKFVRGETSLRLDVADKLAAYYGLELKPVDEPKQKGRK
jgi:plasmid maintenance system antidote protein VapI